MLQIGYDLYSLDESFIFYFLKYVKSKKIKVLHLKHIDDYYIFYIPTYQRYQLHHLDYPLIYIKTIGILKYVLFLSKHYLNILGILCFLTASIGSSYLIYDIQVIGTMPKLNQQMVKELQKSQVNYLYPLKSYEKLNEILMDFKTQYKDQVEYINIYQVGSVFHVEYTKKKQEQLEKEDYRNLYAKKDGMIMSLDIDSGLIKIKKNDYVKKGDLLVENTIISTQNEAQIIPVKGHVYAYTFNQYIASLPNHNQDQGETFYRLLLKIRCQIPNGAIIDKENVLQMTKTRSKITLKVHYTLIENIAIKGDTNEGSH